MLNYFLSYDLFTQNKRQQTTINQYIVDITKTYLSTRNNIRYKRPIFIQNHAFHIIHAVIL